ncbi:membrane protein [Cloacibacterium rupense]|uniref:Membrane protein n=1 Tax=Cloacibacterium rupense TaxID=517423 RepID=A0ABQ2NF54_9FLAO|nr:RagB/SusD family nutrient uptake outer membrane protein [Cloacibacterium rupense]GGP01304.1 membrane protein [Cloacibacterium rupense]
MKFINKKTIFSALFGLSLLAVSCHKDLEREPITDVTNASVYKDFANYPLALGKVYAGIAIGGQSGGDGNADVAGIDGGFSSYMRQLYTMQVITTDEAVIGWNDGNLPDMHKMVWNSSNEFIGAIYYRFYNVIAVANEFIKNTSDERLSANGISGSNATEAKYMRAEARFLRAQAYYHALDLFGNVPFVDENTPAGELPKRIARADLFKYVETELLAVEKELKDAKTNEYGRADKAAAWALLSRLYLNAKVYTGTERNNDVITYTSKVISAGYSLKSKYEDLFLADNNLNNPEVILSVNYDGLKTQTWGGTTFLVHAPVGGDMPAADFGINGGWGGIRTTKTFVQRFDPSDKRGRFFTQGQTLEIDDLGDFKNGYAFIKYKNVTSTGAKGSDTSGNFVDTDIPLYRLADVYLMYAEATLRGGNGNAGTALGYINALRTRAGAPTITSAQMTLDFILDERSRELSWEYTRRTDLIRYGKFTSASYLWPWKGGVKDGRGVQEFRNLFPIPAADITANRNLVQNPGY